MTRTEQALALFGPGHSCSQAILAAFGPGLGLDEDTALRLGRGLGMGLGRGLTCGAVSGAILVLGLAQGPRQLEERGPRFACYEAAAQFLRRFQDVHGAIACRDLLGLDLGTPEGRRQAQERGLFTSLCPQFVKSAGDILEQVL
ncbi:MAG: C_GCAxxG_C_C family protein [Desulfarculus sp.]|nr:C_GCAxxG_C_C family protein [Desulfarculus sp.]